VDDTRPRAKTHHANFHIIGNQSVIITKALHCSQASPAHCSIPQEDSDDEREMAIHDETDDRMVLRYETPDEPLLMNINNRVIYKSSTWIRGSWIIVLANSRERCVFHVDSVWTSTRGRGPAHVDACGQGEGVKTLIFCGRHKLKTPKRTSGRSSRDR